MTSVGRGCFGSCWPNVATTSLQLMLLGALFCTVFQDSILPKLSRVVHLRSLLLSVRLLTFCQLLCYLCTTHFDLYTDRLMIPISCAALADVVVIVTFCFSVGSCADENHLWPCKVVHAHKTDTPESTVSTKDATAESISQQEQREIHQRLREVGLRILRSTLLCCVATSLLCYVSEQAELLNLLLMLSNFAHGRYAQAEVHRVAEELEERVQRTASDKAKVAERNKLAFMQFVLHEVRVPLNSVVLGIDLLRAEEDMPAEALDTLDMMHQSAGFMVATLNDVLSWQKIEQGVMELEQKPFSPLRLVQSVLSSFRVSLEQKQMHVSFHIDNDVPLCAEGDFHRLEHVLANLVSNAVKFSPPDTEIHILVKTRPVQEGEGDPSLVKTRPFSRWLYVMVRDQGIGISAEDRQRLFSPYVQIRPNSMQAGKGTGLGLSICKSIVKAHGGAIGCRSREPDLPVGSEFYFEVPLYECTVEALGTNDDAGLLKRLTAGLARSTSMAKMEVDKLPTAEIGVQTEDEEAEKTVETPPPAVSISLDTTLLRPFEAETVSNPPYRRRASMPELRSAASTPMSSLSLSTSFDGGPVLQVDSMSSNASFSSNYDGSAMIIAPIHVLIVDDVMANRKILEKAVAKKTLVCDSCVNGLESVQAVEQKGLDYYDLIFMDNMMPVMTGEEASRKLRQIGYHKLIVGITGSAMDTETSSFVDSGADIVLPKPVKMDMLHKLLRNCSEFGTTSPQFMKEEKQRDLQTAALKSLIK